MLLFGKTEFSGDLYWTDQSNTSARQNAVNNGEAGDFILYRYVDDEEHIGPHYMDLISQVGTWKINTGNTYLYQYEKKDEQGNTVISSLIDKYDNTGATYFYFAKERLSLADYEIQYDDPVENFVVNGGAVFPNNTAVRNILTGSVVYTVDAKWIAAALQGGTGSVSYKLEKWDPDEGENGGWVTATYVDEEGHLYQWSRTQHYTDDRFDELTDGKNAVGYLNDFYANNIQNGTFDPAEGSKYSDYKTYLDKISADGKLLNTGTVLSDENAWREEFRIRNGYKQGSWDLRDFREYLVGNNAIKQQHFFSTGTQIVENSANGIDWFERVESDLASAAYTDHQTEISEGTLTQAQLDAKISSNKIKGISLESSSTDNHVVYGTNNTQIHYKWYAGRL